jgi:hypothetical protein
MLKKICLTFFTITLLASHTTTGAESLREKLKRLKEAITQPKEVQNTNDPASGVEINSIETSPKNAIDSEQTIAGNNEKTTEGKDDWTAFCKHNFGYGDTVVDLNGKSAEELISQYFNLTADMSEKLKRGITTIHQGSMPNMRPLVKELYRPSGARGTVGRIGGKDSEVRGDMAYRLARAFVDDPSIQNLANIIALAQSTDKQFLRRPPDGPSIVVEAQTVLVLVMLQYPDLILDKQQPLAILSKNRVGGQSILGRTLLARFHLFGDHANQDIKLFSSYIAQTSLKVTGNQGGTSSLVYLDKTFFGKPTLKEQTIFYALDNLPNWYQREEYLEMIRMSAQMQSSLQARNNSSQASVGLMNRLAEVQKQLEEVDLLTLEALNAGPKIAEMRALGDQMRREASGEADLVNVNVSVSQGYVEEMNRLLAAGPSLDEGSKSKLEQANQIRADAVIKLRAISIEAAFSALANGTIDPYLLEGTNNAMHTSCQAALRVIQFSREQGIPDAVVNISDDELL